MKKICVLGLGYIGLPTSVMLALNGYKVIGVDINEDILDSIKKGKLNIKEPYLADMLSELISTKSLILKNSPVECNGFIICVPTPMQNDNTCDLSYVLSAINSITPYIKKGNIIIIESTMPPTTTRKVIKPLIEKNGLTVGKDVYLAFCPERVLPGNIINEIIHNNRIIGGITPRCEKKALQIYSSFVKGEIVTTDTDTAEMTKLVENVYRDVNIALANELAKICNKLGIDVLQVIKFANNHPRVYLHNPGPGVGGHCIPIDPYFLIEKSPELANIISMAREINLSMPNFIVSKVNALLKNIHNPKIAVWGISYKGNTDDIRESPALKIIELLNKKGYNISIFEPLAKGKSMQTCTIEESILEADLILILADHQEFKDIAYDKIAKQMKTPIIFDTKNIIDKNIYDRETMLIINFGNMYKFNSV
ncbi:nucleotide sugar dehydrogenase [Proteiniborus sp.]|uniref:nucleotide sugar dehydrogenase n=1 Tax=Proteiniborus sp. TaxID=2079015 RepID=UPI00332BE9E8